MSSDPQTNDQLVPNKACGACTVCCKALTIRHPDLRKLSGVLCENCREGIGCAIYETRPSVCRNYHCAWRTLPEAQMSDAWRPDRSGLLATFVHDDIPTEFPQLGIKFDILGDAEQLSLTDHPVLSWEPLLQFVRAAVANRFPVFLHTPAPPGFAGTKTLLNTLAARPAMMRDREGLIAALTKAYRSCAAAPKEPVTLDEA